MYCSTSAVVDVYKRQILDIGIIYSISDLRLHFFVFFAIFSI